MTMVIAPDVARKKSEDVSRIAWGGMNEFPTKDHRNNKTHEGVHVPDLLTQREVQRGMHCTSDLYHFKLTRRYKQ
jgi:hypothetical protein